MDWERCMSNGTDNSIVNKWQPVFETQANVLLNTLDEKEACVLRCHCRGFFLRRAIQLNEILKFTDLPTDTIRENPQLCLPLERCSVQPSIFRALNLVVMLSSFFLKLLLFFLRRDFLWAYFIIAVAFHLASLLLTAFTATSQCYSCRC